MGKTSFLIIPLEGNFHSSFVFEADALNSPRGFDCEAGSLETFLACMALHNGVWHMQNGKYGLAVQVVDQSGGKVYPDKLLMVDDVFAPKAVRYVPLKYQRKRLPDGTRAPKDAAGLLAAAAFVLAHGNAFYEGVRLEWEAEHYTREEIVRALKFHLMGDESPWKRNIHVHSVEIIDEEEGQLREQVYLAEQWTFLDNSIAYLTPTGLMTEDEFQHYIVNELKIPQPDVDFTDHYVYSTTLN